MNTEQILQQLKDERDRLSRAIEALEGGRTAGQRSAAAKRSGGITAAGRKRLSELMKKRWAERKKKSAR